MTEETIKDAIDKSIIECGEPYSADTAILEQHEAEMVEFAEWTSHNALVMITKKAWCKRVGYDSPILKCGEIKTTTELLTLFKNRNK